MSTPILHIQNITKNFGGIRALNELSFSVGRDEIVAVIGPNGSGKTTLFNLIVHLYDVDKGQIYFDEAKFDLTRLAPHAINAAGVARTFQTLRLFQNMTVVENVLVGMTTRLRGGLLDAVLQTPRTRRDEIEAEQHAFELMSMFGNRLVSMYNEPASSLSYANRRRLEIVRALASKPKLLLLDEPAAGMNPTETREMMDDIRVIHERGCAILLIEHDMGLVEGLANRVIAIDHGTRIAEGSYRDVCSSPKVIEAYLGSGAHP